jgi:adenylate cyclase
MRPAQKRPLHLAAAVVAVLAVLELGFLHLLAPLENRLLDFFVRTQAAQLTPDSDIVILDIDEKSLAAMQQEAGSWPWPRSVHGELVAGLAAQQPKAIVFDILFAEPDKFRPEHDRAFNDALEGLANVYFPMARLAPADDPKGVPLAQIAAPLGIRKTARADPDARVMLLVPSAIDSKHWRLGLIDFLEDQDGVGRRYHLRRDAYGWEIPSLPARVAQDLGYAVPAGESIVLAWRGGVGAFRHVPYSDVYFDLGRRDRQRPRDEFRDKIVIVGTAASGMHDLRVTPIASLYPGVEVIATALDNLKNQRWMIRAPDAVPIVLTTRPCWVATARFRRLRTDSTAASAARSPSVS